MDVVCVVLHHRTKLCTHFPLFSWEVQLQLRTGNPSRFGSAYYQYGEEEKEHSCHLPLM